MSPVVFCGSLGACRASFSQRGTLCVSRGSTAVLQLSSVVSSDAAQCERSLVIGGRTLSCRSEAEAGRWLRAIAPGELCHDEFLTSGRGIVCLQQGVVRVFGRFVRAQFAEKVEEEGDWNGGTLRLGDRVGKYDGRSCVVGEVSLILAGGAKLNHAGQLVADLPLAATVVGNVSLPLVVLLALISMDV